MSQRIWSALLVGAAVAAVIALVVVVVDIGGEDSSSGEESASTDTPPATQEDSGKAGGNSGKTTGDPGKAGGRGDGGDGNGKKASIEEETRKAIKKIPAEDRQSFADTAARSILESLGLPGSSVTVTEDGETVFVAIPQRYACGVDARKVKEIEKALRGTIISARRFRLNVQSAGSLADYVRDECRDLEIPDADGPVVYSESASGTRSSEEFKIRSRRWTVAYQNGGGELDVIVVKGQDVVKPKIKSTTYEVGKATYRGPGTFRVVATSAARWKVRVYDGT